jgi:erythromycin esterase-like protein
MTATINENDMGAYQLTSMKDLDPLVKKIGDARYVLLGEASHGTHEFYTWRTALSKRLIQEKGFSFLAVEGDWPDCYGINRYVKGHDDGRSNAVEVLKEFKRWPTWMWANWEIVALMEWLREFNKAKYVNRKIGFYGLDVYSLWDSMEWIVNYLRKEDPHTAQLAIEAVRCFEPYEEGQDYARAMLSLSHDCAQEVVKLLRSVRMRARNYDHDPEASLNAEMNAQVIANAEEYYRSMVSFRDQSWNLRDAHMVQTLESIMKFHGADAKAIIWEHNTHVGDARFTRMRDDGLWNVGQLLREKHSSDKDVFIVGFASYEGFVIAGKSWGSKMETMRVPHAVNTSIEGRLHEQFQKDQLILLDHPYWKEKFNGYVGHRAIGVVYHPEYERGNYVPTLLASRYDALIYIDQSNALHPLHIKPNEDQMPETYPFGF